MERAVFPFDVRYDYAHYKIACQMCAQFIFIRHSYTILFLRRWIWSGGKRTKRNVGQLARDVQVSCRDKQPDWTDPLNRRALKIQRTAYFHFSFTPTLLRGFL